MAIFLVQHGKSLSRDQDPEKGLSEKGKTETARIAGVARRDYEIPVSKIVHSGKKRAKQTAEIFKEIFGMEQACEQIDTINPLDDVRAFGDGLGPDSNILVVGHLPFLERLVSYLTAGSEELKIYQFQNSGIVCLDQVQKTWFIKWTLNPDVL